MTPGVPLKRIAELRVERRRNDADGILTLDLVEGGTGRLLVDPWEAPTVPAETGVADVGSGDVLFGKLRPYLAKVVHVDRPAYASTELMCLRPRAKIDSRWFFYRMIAQPTVEWSVATSEGTKMPRTSWERLGEFRVEVPEQRMQRVIADYLDIETARIDALIAKKQALADAVGRRVTATIDQWVWDGAGQRADLRRVANFVDYRGATPAKSEAGIPLITATHVKAGRLNLALDPQFLTREVYDSWMRRGLPRRGDTVITTEAPLGEVAQIESEEVALAQRLILLKADTRRMDPDYLAFALRSTRFQDLLKANATGSTALGIKADRLKALEVPLPGLERQRVVATTLKERVAKESALLDLVTKQLGCLREHRQALITAAVTGELEVTGVA